MPLFPSPIIRRLSLFLVVLLLPLLLAACQEGPDAAQVEATLKARLTQAFSPGTFEITSLRRLGSGPLAAAKNGQPQRIVYFNTVLTLQRDLDFSSWDTLNVTAFANLLGAAEKGVSGLDQAGNRPGDQVRVHGSASFVQDPQSPGGWVPVEVVLPAVGTPSAPLSPATTAQSKQLFERLMQFWDRQTPDPKRQHQIIREELEQAYDTIALRLDRLERALILAGGPEQGEYLGVARLLAETLHDQGTPATALSTVGSAQNLALLRSRKADLVLAQNNLAAQALLGTGTFAQAGPDHALRALASLFPEPLHLLVAADSTIKEPRDLAGRRVEIGQPDSGSRANAILLLEAAGVGLGDLKAIHETGLSKGLEDLAAGRIDAVIATISAPSRPIQKATAQGNIRLLPLPAEVQTLLANQELGMVPMELPPATYPGQHQGVRTLAVTALLVAPEGLPGADVAKVLGALYDGIDFVGAGSAAGSLISRASAATGLTLPLHPAAVAFFAKTPTH